MLELYNITKIYGDKLILKNVSITLESGTFTLLLGANGAGKSTLMRIMANLSHPTSGERHMEEGKKIAYVGHSTFLYPALSALENLAFQASINAISINRKQLLEILNKMRLSAYADEPVRNFSRGMMQRLNFGRAFMLKPHIYLLDEPFTGLDQEAMVMVREELALQKTNGSAIMVISHDPVGDLPLATHVYRLSQGVLEFSGTREDYLKALES